MLRLNLNIAALTGRILLAAAFFGVSLLHAQNNDWYNLDYDSDGVVGASVHKALKRITGDVVLSPVLVAVIDDGVDIHHPDFKGRIWVNPGEVPEDGIDNEGNSYVDDVHGWNFLGNAEGAIIEHENLEITRLLRPLDRRFSGVDAASLKGKDKKDYKTYLSLKAEYQERVAELEEEFAEFSQLTALYSGALAYARERIGRDELSIQDILDHQAADDDERQVLDFLVMAEVQGIRKMIDEGSAYFDSALNYHYNLDFNPRAEVNPDNPPGYGNPAVDAASPEHGTHVAGIIAAIRSNEVGVDGIAPNAIIIPVRAVPDGDERDEDIAAAIRYAVDAGAKVINMSFGKGFSPNKEAVREAALYARSKDVLLVHAAGNDASNNDKVPNYPDGTMGKRKPLDNWITVAASGPEPGSELLADFSNYGRKKVDILAPGVDILSLAPEEGTASHSGTSMAAPVVSGVAALVRGINPALTAKEVKALLIKSARPFPDAMVAIDEEKEVALKKLVRNPAVINADEAVRLAIESR